MATPPSIPFDQAGYNTISMFMGACIAAVMAKQSPKLSEKLIVPVSSGWIAGESLMGVGQAIFTYAAGPIGAAIIGLGLYFGLGN